MRAVRRRTRQLLIFVVALHAVLVGRLFWLQVVQGAEWKETVRRQQTIRQRLRPRRGAILDREGRPLATDSPQYEMFVLPRSVDDRTWRCTRCLRTVRLKPKTTPRRCLDCRAGSERFVELTVPKEERDATIARFLDVSPETFRALVDEELAESRKNKATSHDPRRLDVRVPQELQIEFEMNPLRYPGLEIRATRSRHYHEPDVMPHVLGTVGIAMQSDVARLKPLGFAIRDLYGLRVGREGIERTLNERLVGRMGFRDVDFHRAGRVLKVIEEKPPQPGADLMLSIDLDLQRAAERALDGRGEKPCAFTAIDVRTGEVLTAATAPRFRISDKREFDRIYRSDPKTKRLYLHERSYGQARTPGSVFKIVTAYALLKHGLDPREEVRCGGVFVRGRTRIGCNSNYHASLGLVEALERSCNVYFMEMSVRLGAEALHAAAAELGVGLRPDIEVAIDPGSQGRNVDLASVARMPGELWLNAFGQGSVQTTPLQMARIAAFVANDGRLPPLTFLHGGAADKPWTRPAVAGLIAPIRAGMRRAVHGSKGTARKQGLQRFAIAAKTGTGETGLGTNRAWLVGYAPHDDPQVAFACLVDETDGHGAEECGPIVRAWFEAWEAKKLAEKATEVTRVPPEDGG